MLLEFLIIAAVLGLICDALASRQAKREGRPYGLAHFLSAMLFGWVLTPIGVLVGLMVFIWGLMGPKKKKRD